MQHGVRTGLVLLVVAAAAIAALVGATTATAAACGAGTVAVTPMQSPDGTTRPFYGDFKSGSTKHSGYVGYELTGASGVLGSDVWIKLSGFTGGSVDLATNQSAAIPVRATSQSGKPLVYAYLTAASATTTAQSWTVEVWNGKPGQTGSTQVCTATDGFSKVLDVISAGANKITSMTVSTTAPAIGGKFDVTAVGDTGTMGAGDASDQFGGNGVFSMSPSMDDSWPADAFQLTGVQLTIGGTSVRDKLRTYLATSAAGAYTVVYSFTARKAPAAATSVFPVQNIASGTQVKYTGSYNASLSLAVPSVTVTLTKTPQALTGPPYVLNYTVVAANTSSSPVTLDYLRDTPTSSGAWSFSTGSARLGGSTIPDPVNDAGTLVFSGPFSVPANGSLTFTYALNVSATVSNSVVGQVGDVALGNSGGNNQVTVNPAVPAITTASLPDGTVGAGYDQTLAATGGTGSYTWAVLAGSLPAGLSLNPITGRLSGTPTAAGSSSFTIQVTDGAAASGSKVFTVATAAAAPSDTTAPSGSIVLAGGAATTTAPTISVALSATDAVGVTRYRLAEGPDCSAAGWTNVTASTTFSATTSLTLSAGEGSKTVCVQYGDAAGNVSTAATSTVTYDLAPTVALASAAGDPTNAAFTVTATFSKAVTGFALGDLAIGNGTASNLAGSGATYTFDVTPSAQGAVTVDLGAGAATDAAGIANAAAAQLARTYDSVRPTLALSSAASDPVSGAFAVTATFSESVSGFALGDLVVTNGSASNLTGSGATYTFDITPTADGAVTVNVGANVAADAAGNGNAAATALSRTYDATAPSVTLSSAAADPVSGAFSVTATFSESVSGFALGDLTLTNATASSLSGSGATYSFTVTPAADGLVTVALGAGAATDAAGNTSTAASPLTRTADLGAPSLVLATAVSDPTNGAFVVTATFSEPVLGFALGDLVVTNGSASNLTGSGSNYSFTVAPVADGAVTVDVGAAAATDAGGNASLAAAQLSRMFDGTRPSVALSSPAADAVSGRFLVTATFSESVTGFALGDLALTNANATGLAGSGATYTFDVTPLADGTVTVALPAGAAADGAGNASTAATPLTRAADVAAPRVVLATTATDPTGGAFTVSATFAEPVTGFTSSDLVVADGSVSAFAGSGALYSFLVTPAAAGVVGIDLPAGAATDAAGNASAAATTLTRTYAPVVPAAAVTDDAPVEFTLRPPVESQPDGVFTWMAPRSDATFTCTLDGAAPFACASPWYTSDLLEGPHTLRVQSDTGGSTSYTWTVRRGAVPPPASVVIVPKIKATDLIGRPQAFQQAQDVARSKGPFTRKLNVELKIPTPENVNSDVVFISNYPDFSDVRVFPIAADESYDWNLLAGPSGDRRVYIRFSDDPSAAVGEATIVVDQELPTLRPAFLRIGTVPRARTNADSAAPACGAAPRRWLRIGGADGFSGLNAVQIATDVNHPCAWRPFLPEFSYRLASRVVYVRVADRVGNISSWYRVTTRR